MHMHHIINLLPPEKMAALKRVRLNDRLIKYSVLLFAFIGVGLFVLDYYVDTLREQRNVAQRQAAELEANLQTFKALTEQALFINDRIQSIDTQITSRRSWTLVLADLAASTPGDVEVTAFSPAFKGTIQTFSITAEAGSRTSMITFKNALDATTSFANVTFETSNLADTNEPDSRVTFTLTGQIGDTPAPKPESPTKADA